MWLFVKHPLGARVERKKVMGAKGSGRRMAPVKGVRLGRRSCRVAYCNHYGPPRRSGMAAAVLYEGFRVSGGGDGGFEEGMGGSSGYYQKLGPVGAPQMDGIGG